MCDASKAILAAVIRAFTSFGSTEEYVNALYSGPLPLCYVRLDVAHFIHLAAKFLKTEKPRVKKFHLAALGQLILARTLDNAAALFRSTLTVCKSETEGYTVDNEITPCEKEKQTLKSLLTGEEMNTIIEQECGKCYLKHFLVTPTQIISAVAVLTLKNYTWAIFLQKHHKDVSPMKETYHRRRIPKTYHQIRIPKTCHRIYGQIGQKLLRSPLKCVC